MIKVVSLQYFIQFPFRNSVISKHYHPLVPVVFSEMSFLIKGHENLLWIAANYSMIKKLRFHVGLSLEKKKLVQTSSDMTLENGTRPQGENE